MLKILTQSSFSARAGMIIILFNFFIALMAPVIAPYDETAIVGGVWEPSSPSFYLGTDNIGRDLYTRMIYGARNTIALACLTTSLSFFIGTFFGFLAAVKGALIDQVLSRCVDIVMSLPSLIFALLILSVLGSSIPVLLVTIALLDSTRVYRLSRAVAMDIAVMEYVEAAKLRGEKAWWIMSHEIFPNALTPLLAEFGLRFCFVFLFIASLSFLGLGIQPPMADWGGMVRENANAITFGIYIPLIPAAAIAFLTIGVNLVVDWFLTLSSDLREG